MKNTYKVLDSHKNFLAVESEFCSFEQSKVVVVPVRFGRGTKGRTGAQNGPDAVIRASHELDGFDEETKREVYREHGIATLVPLNLTRRNPETALQEIHETVLRLTELNKFVVMLGSEHIGTSAVIAAFAKKVANLSVLHFDAHSNLRQNRPGENYTSASAMARVCEYLDPSRLVQVGIRAQSKDEAEYARDNKVRVFYAHEIHGGAHTRLLKYWDDAVVECMTEDVFVLFDVDAFDPSIMPATLTPEPGGLSWSQVMRCLRKVGQRRRIVGFSVVGLSPIRSMLYPDLTVAKLALKLLNYAL